MPVDRMSDAAVAYWSDPPDDAVGTLHAARKLAAEVAALRAELASLNDLRDRLLADGCPLVIAPEPCDDGAPLWGVWNGIGDWLNNDPIAEGETIGEALADAVRAMGMEP